MSCCPKAITSSTFFQRSNECLHSKWFVVALLVSSVVFFSLAALGGVGFFAPGNIFSQGIIGAIGHNGCLAVLISGFATGGLGVVISSLTLLAKIKVKILLKKAAEEGDVKKLRELAANGVDIGMVVIETGDTALHVAIRHHKIDFVLELLKFDKIDVNVQNKSGMTALHWAVSHPEIIEDLRQRDVDFNIQNCIGNTALHDAVGCLASAAVEKLIDHSDTTIKNMYGKTARDCLEKLNHHIKDYNCIKKLFKNKEIIQVVEEGDIEQLNKLAANEVDIGGALKEEGETTLHVAICNNQYDMVKYLLGCEGIDINAQTTNGWTALHYAAFYGFNNLIDLLKERDDLDFNVQNFDENTPLHLAVINLNSTAVEKLIDNSDITIKNKDGKKAWKCLPENCEPDNIVAFSSIDLLFRNKDNEDWEEDDLEINSD